MIEELLEFSKKELERIVRKIIDEKSYSLSVFGVYNRLLLSIKYNHSEVLLSNNLEDFISDFIEKYNKRLELESYRNYNNVIIRNPYRYYLLHFLNSEGIPKHIYKDIIRVHKKNENLGVQEIINSLDLSIDYKVPTFLKEFSYAGMVKDYFGLDLIVGDNAPRLSRQLSSKSIEYTDKEIEAFGQLKAFFEQSKEHKLYIDTENMDIPFIMDNWSPNSCHNRSGAGNFTHFENELLGFSMLKIYAQRTHLSNVLSPYMRAYFYKKDDDIAHAGCYSSNGLDGGYPLYSITTLLLCVLFGKRLEDFKTFSGLPNSFYNEDFYIYASVLSEVDDEFEDEEIGFWNNMHSSTNYTKYTTNKDIFDNLPYVNITAIADVIRQDSDYYIVDYFNTRLTCDSDNLYMEEN